MSIRNLSAYDQTPPVVAPPDQRPGVARGRVTIAANINAAIDLPAEAWYCLCWRKAICLRGEYRVLLLNHGDPT